MKRFLIHLILFAAPSLVLGQRFDAYASYEFKSKEDYRQHEDTVLAMADYILSVPVDAANKDRLIALRTLIQWMSGTPDHRFSIDESLTPLMKKNDEIVGLYMAAATKVCLEHKEGAGDAKSMKLHTYEALLAYCEKESNGIRKNKELQKAIHAKNTDTLAAYLKL